MRCIKPLAPIIVLLSLLSITAIQVHGRTLPQLRRERAPKPTYDSAPSGVRSGTVVFKFREGTPHPEFDGRSFAGEGPEWAKLNRTIDPSSVKNSTVRPYFTLPRSTLAQMRAAGGARVSEPLPDLSLYHALDFSEWATPEERLATVRELNDLDIIEIAYFQPVPSPATINAATPMTVQGIRESPNWESEQVYLGPAPEGVNAYHAWQFIGGKGNGVKVIDIEVGWTETHEDLHGGTDSFHIAGPVYGTDSQDHGTAVLGVVAADSNGFGMTGISYEVDLGTISISEPTFDGAIASTPDAIMTATANSEPGDVILIELHAPGPHFNFEPQEGQRGYVCMEYWQAIFDAILTASSLGRIVVEAAGNGGENFDNEVLYDPLFDPDYRHSGALIVGATYMSHDPAWYTNYGQRVDVHGFGLDVYTLGYGDLFGWTPDNEYTAEFAGTSSASPMLVGAVACLQGINKYLFETVLDHNELRALLTRFSTPQLRPYIHVGPMPDLLGSVDSLVALEWSADTTTGQVPFDVAFSATSGHPVDDWRWSFGDGDSASVQSPSHTYQVAGIHDVALEVESQGKLRRIAKEQFIIALGDTIATEAVEANPGDTVEVVFRGRNILPLTKLEIPLEFGGEIDLEYVAHSTAGMRTEQFEQSFLAHLDPSNSRLAIELRAGDALPLPAGEGAVLTVAFRIPEVTERGSTNSISPAGYLARTPKYTSPSLVYEPVPQSATLSICPPGGDVDGSGNLSISDLTALVDFLFRDGSPPTPMSEGDVNCSGQVDVSDLSYLVNYLFRSGPEPCGC